MEAKQVSFMIMMGVLGNVLFMISNFLNLGAGISFDLSHIATYIAGFYGGPLIGFISGIFVGLMPGIVYGPMGNGALLGLIGLPLGKGLTGLTAGLLASRLRLGKRKYTYLLLLPSTLVAYIPEVLFTYAYFAYLLPILLGGGGAFLFFAVIPKALTEITIIAFLMSALRKNSGFNDFVARFFASSPLKTSS
ncbi:MAG: ECF transporter S component [Thermoproteota archaeon]